MPLIFSCTLGGFLLKGDDIIKRKGNRQAVIVPIKRKVYELDAETIAFYRRNPLIACEDLLGIRLFDAQAWILQCSWNAGHILWCCSRNFGKSFLASIFIILKAILYENQSIYIVSSVGDQAKETFTKIEEIITRLGKTSASIKSLKDIVEKEIVKNNGNKTGFVHNPAGFEVSFFNGSSIFTINSSPSSARSRRATLVFFDEAAFCSDELVLVCEAFASQNKDFITSTDENYTPELEKRKVPTQLLYASSQDTIDKIFYRHYKNFAKRMLAGDRDYFVADMSCETAITTFMRGKPYTPLLTRDKVESAMKANPVKAEREYYNKPISENNKDQIIHWRDIRRNESFYLPVINWRNGYKYTLAYDPARVSDNSIVGIMELYEDSTLGICGRIVNMVNFIDKKNNKQKLKAPDQLKGLRKLICDYNGNHAEYEFIDKLLIDTGAGGGGISSYADNLLSDYKDDKGQQHRGLIDKSYKLYKDSIADFPNASDKLLLIDPRKFRTQMIIELLELIELNVIKFPFEYSGKDIIKVKNNDEDFTDYELNDKEKLALAELDLLKVELTSIEKRKSSDGASVNYSLSQSAVNRGIHDDRFYVMLLLAHRLYELRRGQIITPKKKNNSPVMLIKQCKSTYFRK